MSFLYPRLISIARPTQPATVASIGYGGVDTAATETVIFTGLQASIQAKSGTNRTRSGDIPSSAPGPIQWTILLPKSAPVRNGDIVDRDIAIDDLGARYQVEAAYWAPLGYQLKTIRLEAH